MPKVNNQIIAAIARDKGSGPNEKTILHQGSAPSPVMRDEHFTVSRGAVTYMCSCEAAKTVTQKFKPSVTIILYNGKIRTMGTNREDHYCLHPLDRYSLIIGFRNESLPHLTIEPRMSPDP